MLHMRANAEAMGGGSRGGMGEACEGDGRHTCMSSESLCFCAHYNIVSKVLQHIASPANSHHVMLMMQTQGRIRHIVMSYDTDRLCLSVPPQVSTARQTRNCKSVYLSCGCFAAVVALAHGTHLTCMSSASDKSSTPLAYATMPTFSTLSHAWLSQKKHAPPHAQLNQACKTRTHTPRTRTQTTHPLV